MGRRGLVGTAAALLAVTGCLSLGLRSGADPSHLADTGETSTSSAASSATSRPTTTSASTGDDHRARPAPSPEDTQPPVSIYVSPSVEPDAAPVDAPAATVEAPSCGPPVKLTVLSVDGCPVNTIVNAVTGAVTQRSGRPSEEEQPLLSDS